MLASVVIDNYQYGRYLAAAIDSALAQTHADTEVVVVDDGSTDGSREVIAGYGDAIVAVLKDNGGQGSAVNAGFAACRGDAVLVLDADDLLAPGAVERAVAALADERVVKVHWPLEEIGPGGERLGRLRPAPPLPEGDLVDAAIRDGPDAYLTPPMSGNAWSRRFLAAVLPMDEPRFRIAADAYLLCAAPFHGTFAAIEVPLGSYRQHGAQHHGQGGFDARIGGMLDIYRAMEDVMAAECRSRGIEPDLARWRERSYWPRLRATVDALDAAVRPGAEVLLVDDGHLWLETDERRRPRPFLDRPGEPWAAPAGAAEAVAELERMRAAGAAFLAFVWPAFWWRDAYPDFERHLRERYACVADDGNVVVFDLERAR